MVGAHGQQRQKLNTQDTRLYIYKVEEGVLQTTTQNINHKLLRIYVNLQSTIF